MCVESGKSGLCVCVPCGSWSCDVMCKADCVCCVMFAHAPACLNVVLQTLSTTFSRDLHAADQIWPFSHVLSATLRPSRFEPQPRQVSEPLLPRLNAQELSQIVQALGSMDAQPPSHWLAAVLHVSGASASQYSPQALSCLLYGVACMGGPAAAGLGPAQGAAWVSTFLDASLQLLEKSTGGSPSATTTTISSSNGAAAHHSSASSADGSEGSAAGNGRVQGGSSSGGGGSGWADMDGSNSSDRFTAEELGYLLYSLASMNATPPAPWLTRVLSVLEHGEGMMSALGSDGKVAAMVVWSLAQLLRGPPSNTTTSGGQHTQQQHGNGVVVHSHSVSSNGATAAAYGASSGGSLNGAAGGGHAAQQGQHVSSRSTHSSSSTGGLHEGVGLADAAGEEAAGRLSRTSLPHHPAQLPASFLDSLAAVSAPRLRPRYGPLELATMLTAFSRWGYIPPFETTWLPRFWWRSLVLMGQGKMPPAALMITLQALERLQLTPHKTWWLGALKASAASFPLFLPHHFGGVMRSMAALGARPPVGWVRACLLATYRVWGGFEPQAWTEVLWALAEMKVRMRVRVCACACRRGGGRR